MVSKHRKELREEGGGRREDDTRRMEGRGRERQGEIGERATIDARKRRLATKGTQETDLIYTRPRSTDDRHRLQRKTTNGNIQERDVTKNAKEYLHQKERKAQI